MIDILELSKKVLTRLAFLGKENAIRDSNEQLIFPLKRLTDGTKETIRISEQEMRLLFIEEFKIKYPNLYYSIETPTTGKFSFGKTWNEIKLENEGQSASHDMCIFEKKDSKYERIMNIEFKHRNSGIAKSGKDVLKLIREEQDGAFIHLLENTNSNTIISVFRKLAESFEKFKTVWIQENKTIQIVILSLEQKKLIHCELRKSDLFDNNFFVLEQKFGNIDKFNNSYWSLVELDKN
ncbi:hypothetical protein ACFFLS_07035 [Flavobacterium procerum]|uniref:Restriction endonuclease n=1 Tax=Flavobacterium procerum TaxID=1455569 RepID=A0ABV6BQ84_9FLAO